MIPIEIIILLFFFLIVVIATAIYLGSGNDGFNFIISKISGKGEKKIEAGLGKTAEPKFPTKIRNQHGELYRFRGKLDKSKQEFITYQDDCETPRETIKYLECNQIENYHDFLSGRADHIILKQVTGNTYASMRGQINAMKNIIAQKDRQIDEITVSLAQNRKSIAKEDNRVARIRWKDQQKKTVDISKKSKSKSSSEEESEDYGSEMMDV